MQCDNSLNETCEMLGSFELIEEVINSIFGEWLQLLCDPQTPNSSSVFVIRFAERKIDQLLDPAILDYSSQSPEYTDVRFESDWSFLRPFASKKKINNALRHGTSSPSIRPPSPTVESTASTPTSMSFSSLRQSFSRARSGSPVIPLQSIFPDTPPPPSPADVTSFLTALHTFLTLSEINPALITQLWSQILYWTSCRLFPIVLQQKFIHV
jgi:hypothetical protein